MEDKGKGSERFGGAIANLTEMALNLESLQKLLLKKAVFVDEETFTKASLCSEQARTIKVFSWIHVFQMGFPFLYAIKWLSVTAHIPSSVNIYPLDTFGEHCRLDEWLFIDTWCMSRIKLWCLIATVYADKVDVLNFGLWFKLSFVVVYISHCRTIIHLSSDSNLLIYTYDKQN